MPSDSTICHFVPAEELWEETHKFFKNETMELRSLFPFPIRFEHVGGTSVPGLLTKGDIDIQIIVENGDFPIAVDLMKSYAKIKKPEVWTSEKAVFKRNDKTFSVDYFLIISGSPWDSLYREARDLLISNPKLLEKYNAIKRSFEGRSYAEYRPIKKEFWYNLQHT